MDDKGNVTKPKRRSRLKMKGRSVVPGTAPGTLKIDPNAPKPQVRVIAYNSDKDADSIYEEPVDDLSVIPDLLNKWATVWVDVSGLGDMEVISKLQEQFNLHRLALEDVLNVNQRPKAEEYDNVLFIVSRLSELLPGLFSEQISIFLGKGFVLTFQERVGDCFDGVRERLRKGKGRIRVGPDHLTYALLDSIIDHYFPILEHYGERLEKLEEDTLDRPSKATLTQIYNIRRDLLLLRRSIWPLRDLMNSLIRDQQEFFVGETSLFLRDCYDHVIQIIDLIENYREVASGLVDLYLSSVSNRMNDVMKVLTLIATIFIPLGFIAGLYGMNFDNSTSPWNMPELHWRYGYPLALVIMGLVAGGMVLFFRRKGWIGSSREK